MSEEPCFRYWAVECKTHGCDLLVLCLIGPCHLARIPFLKHCRNFELICRKCGESHIYTNADVRFRDLPQAPPPGFRGDPAFLAATQQEQHQDELEDLEPAI